MEIKKAKGSDLKGDRVKRSLANVQDYQKTFSTVHGKKVLQDLMMRSGMRSCNFVPSDPYSTAFNEGNRQIVLYVLQKLNIDIKKLEEMLTKEDSDDESAFMHNI